MLLIKQVAFNGFLWQCLQRSFGYASPSPSVRDFAIELFKSCYAMGFEEKAALSSEALVFLKRWEDSQRYHQAFETLSDECADILAIKQDLHKRHINSLVDLDYFKLIDQKILSDLVQQVANRTISAGDCAKIIWRRRTTHWYSEFSHIYEAIYFASQFMYELDRASLMIQSLRDGITKYANTWYRLDQLYRKFIFHTRASKQVSLLESLNKLIENLYSNNYLLKVNDNWQHALELPALGCGADPFAKNFLRHFC